VEEPTRRAVVMGGVAAGASVLVGCSGSGTSAGGGGSSGPLVAVSDVPVGGAVAAKDASGPIIVAQPTAGKVVAFSAICTHMGCQVAPAGAQLNCPCHGSQYNALTGAVLRGPAPKPLPPVAVHVENGQVLPGSG
jgi:cytochrome b6-f complex iron-sulfur subunit